MSQFAIKAEKISKSYRLGGNVVPYQTIRERMSAVFSGLINQVSPPQKTVSSFWALKDISFEADHGQTIGIIGRNGAGKSTLLKLLARITKPTSGRATVYGRMGSLLEVGTGFHPELTGRENIYLNGAILGMLKTEINQKFDEIVAFSEIERFLDTPVKYYSSGMYMRLAFSVAAHLDPEILLVDEVLAVGDAAFQKKCLGKMQDVSGSGRTILFVSHNHQAVRRLCERCIWLEEGHLKQMGPTTDVLEDYLHTINTDVRAEDLTPDPSVRDQSNPLRLLRLAVCDENRTPTSLLYGEQSYYVEIEYEFLHAISNVRFALLFRTAQDVDAFLTTDCDVDLIKGQDRKPGRYLSRCKIPPNLLSQGRYRISVWGAVTHVRQLSRRYDALIVDVQYTKGWIMQDNRNAALNPLLEWHTKRLDI